MHTRLVQQQINDLSHIIKEKHKHLHFDHLPEIIHEMGHVLHYDKRVNNVYNKTEVINGSLHQVFVQNQSDHNVISEHKKGIKTAYDTINRTLEHFSQLERLKKKKRESNCFPKCF